MNKLFSILVILLFSNQLISQVYTNKEVGAKNATIIDSLKNAEYPYVLPIWGEKAAKKGFNLPYSAGLSINYFGQKSDLIIEDLYVGFNYGPQYDLDEIVRFNSAISTANSISLRPDIWVFPFLNIYGILAKAKTSTEIGAGLWLPDTSNVWHELVTFKSKAEFDATTFGFGMTPTVGVGGGWMALDMNVTWTDVDALDKPVFTFVFGPRIGKTFKFKKKDSNIAIWAGGFRVKLSNATNGSLKLNEVMPIDELQVKVDNGLVKVEDAQVAVDTWWDGLSSIDQKNPVNVAKYEAANRTIDAAAHVLTTLDGAMNDEQYATVQYSLNKRPKDMWNFVVGTQYQLNKHFMFRAEYGFLGSRQQFTGGIQYRFGL
jgi:hypothetical protein